VTPEDFCTWLRFVVAPLVTKPTDVTVVGVYRNRNNTKLVLEMGVAPDDRGRVIGRDGETLRGLKAITAAAGGRHGLRVTLDLNDEAVDR